MRAQHESETWLPIPGWDGCYEVSDLGHVRSLPRTVLGRNGVSQPVRGRMLALCSNNRGQGYFVVHLKRNKARTPMTVHRAVLEAFRGPRAPGQVARHLDGDAKNNRLENLAWGTPSENSQDTLLHGQNEKANRTHCVRNHVLAEPNLTLQSLKTGHRGCLACHRTSARLAHAKRTGRAIDFDAVADQYYRAIMAGEAPATHRRGPRPGLMKGYPRGTLLRDIVPAQRSQPERAN